MNYVTEWPLTPYTFTPFGCRFSQIVERYKNIATHQNDILDSFVRQQHSLLCPYTGYVLGTAEFPYDPVELITDSMGNLVPVQAVKLV